MDLLTLANCDRMRQAWHILGLMDPSTASFCDLEPLMADLGGGLSSFINLRPVLQQIQDKISSNGDRNNSIFKEHRCENGENLCCSPPGPARRLLAPKARIRVEQTCLPEYQELQPLAEQLQDMVDLERVVVVVGFGEIGECNQRFMMSKLIYRWGFWLTSSPFNPQAHTAAVAPDGKPSAPIRFPLLAAWSWPGSWA